MRWIVEGHRKTGRFHQHGRFERRLDARTEALVDQRGRSPCAKMIILDMDSSFLEWSLRLHASIRTATWRCAHLAGGDALSNLRLYLRGDPVRLTGDIHVIRLKANAILQRTLPICLRDLSARRTMAFDAASSAGSWNKSAGRRDLRRRSVAPYQAGGGNNHRGTEQSSRKVAPSMSQVPQQCRSAPASWVQSGQSRTLALPKRWSLVDDDDCATSDRGQGCPTWPLGSNWRTAA